MRIATGIIETYQAEDFNLGPTTEQCITSIAEDFDMSPAERATLTANHAVTLPDLSTGLIVQLDYEPEDYSYTEWYRVNDSAVSRTATRPFRLRDLANDGPYIHEQL